MTPDTLAEIEADLIAAALFDPRITDTIALTEREFYRPELGAAWDAIRIIHLAHRTPTPGLIIEEAAKKGVRVDQVDFAGMVGRGMPMNAEGYAATITDQKRRRDMRRDLERGINMLDQGVDTEAVTTATAKALDVTRAVESDVEDMQTLDEFVDQPLPPEEWIIPNLLAKGDRTIVTGEEGFGKSVLIRQIAVCAAAGLDPFTFQRFAPKRVLVIDAENPRRIMQKRLVELRDGMRNRKLSTDDRLWIKRYPQGFDLTAVSNRLTLHNLCQMVNPDLLVIGPAYKLYEDDGSRDEALARRVTSALDGLREEFDMGLLLEHHSPHASGSQKRDLRPIGSSLWRRWSEFGIGLAPGKGTSRRERVADVEHWRGGRDDRPWPEQLVSGTNGIPWVVADPHEYLARVS